MGSDTNLSPTMVSRKLQVLDFAKAYFVRWSRAPSYGEIGAALRVSRDTVKRHVASLVREGRIRREPGARRAMTFPELEGQVSIEEAARVLALAGWTVNPGQLAESPYGPLTFPPLPCVPELDHIPNVVVGEQHHVRQQSGRSTRDARDHGAAP